MGEFCGKRDIEEFTQNVLEKNWNQSGWCNGFIWGSIIAGGDILAEAIQNEVAKKNIIVGGAGHTTETLRNVAGATDYFREFRLFYFVTRKDRKVWMFIWQRN